MGVVLGRYYSTTTTFHNVLVWLKRSFQELNPEAYNYYKKISNKNLKDTMEFMRK